MDMAAPLETQDGHVGQWWWSQLEIQDGHGRPARRPSGCRAALKTEGERGPPELSAAELTRTGDSHPLPCDRGHLRRWRSPGAATVLVAYDLPLSPELARGIPALAVATGGAREGRRRPVVLSGSAAMSELDRDAGQLTHGSHM
jgi:hypothetical protein